MNNRRSNRNSTLKYDNSPVKYGCGCNKSDEIQYGKSQTFTNVNFSNERKYGTSNDRKYRVSNDRKSKLSNNRNSGLSTERKYGTSNDRKYRVSNDRKSKLSNNRNSGLSTERKYGVSKRKNDDRSLDDLYCDCVIHVSNKQSAYNPYAVCKASIFNRRGLKAPGTECFDKYKFENYNTEELRSYAELLGFTDVDNMNDQQVLNMLQDLQLYKRKYPFLTRKELIQKYQQNEDLY